MLRAQSSVWNASCIIWCLGQLRLLTNYHALDGLFDIHLFLTDLRLGSSRSGCHASRLGFWCELSSWFAGGPLSTVSSQGRETHIASSLMSLFIRMLIQLWGPHQYNLVEVYFNLLKASLSLF